MNVYKKQKQIITLNKNSNTSKNRTYQNLKNQIKSLYIWFDW